jgi:hypothetical protein
MPTHTAMLVAVTPNAVVDLHSLLDDLEAGRPVVLQGRQLKGHSMPDTHVRRDQAFDWFEVRPDDTIRPPAPEH